MNLFGMLEGAHNSLILLLGDAFRVAGHRLDVGLKVALEHLVHLGVVVVIVPDAVHTVNVVPDGLSECSCVNLTIVPHSVISEVEGGVEAVLQQIANVAVQPVGQGKALVLPGIILNSEGRDLQPWRSFGKVGVGKIGVYQKPGQVLAIR